MLILYLVVGFFTARNLLLGYAETREMMEEVQKQAGDSSPIWIKGSLLFSWLLTLFLILFAKVTMSLPASIALVLLLMKLPVLGLTHHFFNEGRYSRLLFFSDKIDQATTLALCGYVCYYSLVIKPA